MGQEVKVIADSISEAGNRLTTLQLKYQRFIHSEFMTHRVFSRNASSSRAIPVAKMIEQVRNDPAMPMHWGANQSGMRAHKELGPDEKGAVARRWLVAAEKACVEAERMVELGLHKQVANRILEPFQWIHVVVSATDWDNFFELRCHPDAQPEFQALAVLMRDAMKESVPAPMSYGDWHLPYVTEEEKKSLHINMLIQSSVARCARVSYLTHDGKTPDLQKDLALYDRLVGSRPLHASPTEHVASPLVPEFQTSLSGNFTGWFQYRKAIEVVAHAKRQATKA